MMSTKKHVRITSATKHDNSEYPPGECSPYPFEAKPEERLKFGPPLAIVYRRPAPAIAPRIWATIYAGSSDAGNRPAAVNPTETAGFRWQPEMCPMAYAIVRTVRPKASE